MKLSMSFTLSGALLLVISCGHPKKNDLGDSAVDSSTRMDTSPFAVDTHSGPVISDSQSDMGTDTGDSATAVDTAFDTGSTILDSTDTEDSIICVTGKRSCAGDMVRLCEGGVWVDWNDCTISGRICTVIEGLHQCVDTLRDDTVSGSDSGTLHDTETVEMTDTDLINNHATDSTEDTATETGSEPDVDSDTNSDTVTPACVNFPWSVQTRPVNMLILLDRSNSMKKYPIEGTDVTHAEIMRDSIGAIVEKFTSSGSINFALNAFPSPVLCDSEYHNPELILESEILCEAASQFTDSASPYSDPLVPFAESITMDTVDAVNQVLSEVGNCGGTPMTKSLQWAKVYLESLNLKDDTYVLLATDGAPGCNFDLDYATCESASVGITPQAPEMCLDADNSAHAVYDLAQAGFKTFVLGVGQDVAAFSDVLDVIAYWGINETDDSLDFSQVPDPPMGGNWYYPAADSETITAALADVSSKAISCEFDVTWRDVPAIDPETGTEVAQSCATTRIFGHPSDGGNKIEITYMESCVDENPNAGDQRTQLGWTWPAFEGKPWTAVEATADDTSTCTRVKLCHNACNMLQNEWRNVSASFGCAPQRVTD
ncbi:MAG: hypothetical protein JXX14_21935 [Deltaproteobacteria bacterium]|nr:hypothetical protein [Deltaproteobacteria bacterium]